MPLLFLPQLSRSPNVSPPVPVQGIPATPACGPARVPPEHRPLGRGQDHPWAAYRVPWCGLRYREEGPALPRCARVSVRARGIRVGACCPFCPLLGPRKLLPGGCQKQGLWCGRQIPRGLTALPLWSGHGHPILQTSPTAPTAAHHGGCADSQAARPGKRPEELPWTFHGHGLKINLGVLANSRAGETWLLRTLTDSTCVGPGRMQQNAACPPPTRCGRETMIRYQMCQAQACRLRGLPAPGTSGGWQMPTVMSDAPGTEGLTQPE